MRIIFLTQYFPPEVGAPQNRLFEIALRLKKMGNDIEIVTAMPNYPKMEVHQEYKRKFYTKELLNTLPVHRCYIYASKSRSIISRLLNYFSFVFSSLLVSLVKVKRADFIFCESPPLFLGISAYLFSRIKRTKLIFNISDLWPESAEKLGIIKNKFLLKSTTKLEEFFYKKSSLITGQTQGIVANIQSRFPDKKVYWLPNGVDIDFFKPDETPETWRKENGFENTDILFLYAGIIGHAQGLEVILHAAEKLKTNTAIKFILVGEGPEKEKLMLWKEQHTMNNVFFFKAIEKNKMPELIKSCNAGIIPLRKIELFKGAIPSKIFETLCMKKPILLGVEGEAKDLFITNANAGLAFEPENAEELAQKIIELLADSTLAQKLGENGHNYVKANFNRNNIAEKFYKQLTSV